MMPMTEAELERIAARVALFVQYGDPDALYPEDVAALLDEARSARAHYRHLHCVIRQLKGLPPPPRGRAGP